MLGERQFDSTLDRLVEDEVTLEAITYTEESGFGQLRVSDLPISGRDARSVAASSSSARGRII